MPVGDLVAALSTETLSFAALFSLLWFFSWLDRSVCQRLFPRQLVQLALADLLFAIGSTMQDLLEFGDIVEHDAAASKYCFVSSWIFQYGRIVSILTESHIAIAFVCFMFQAVSWFPLLTRSLRWLWVIGLLATLLEVWQTGWQQGAMFSDSRCKLSYSDYVAPGVFLACFVSTLVAYSAICVKALRQRGSGLCVVIRRTSVYPLCFLFSYMLITVELLYPKLIYDRGFYLPAQILQHLNGFFNVICYFVQSRYVQIVQKRSLPAVGLDTWESAGTADRLLTDRSSPAEDKSCSCSCLREALSSRFLPRSEQIVLLNLCYLEGLDMLGERSPSEIRGDTSSSLNRMILFESAPSAQTTNQNLQSSVMRQAAALRATFSLSAFLWRGNQTHRAPIALEQIFVTEKSLGGGEYSKVELVQAQIDYGAMVQGKQYAAKYLRRCRLGNLQRYAYSERDIMSSTAHAGVVRLFHAFKVNPQMPTWVLVMEYCPGGDLHQKLLQEGPTGLPDELVHRYAAETLQAIAYLHSMQIMHRDLKPANIMLTSRDRCKVADFGLARVSLEGASFCGTRGYVAPEVVEALWASDTYGPAADLYSWGRVVLDLHVGLELGFDISRALAQLASQGAMNTHSLVSQATALMPDERGTVSELQRHVYFDNLNWHELLMDCVRDEEALGP